MVTFELFYFLAFSVLVTAFNKDQGGTKLLVSLHKGMSFGVTISPSL